MATGSAAGADLRILAPSAPGSGWDQLAQSMKAALEAGDPPRSVVVRNVPGGSGAAGLAQFLSAPQDTDLMVTGLTMMGAMLAKHSTVSLQRLTPIARLSTDAFAVVVPAASPIRSIADLRNALQIEPGRVTWGGGPAGGLDQAAAALLVQACSIPAAALNYVPFLATGDAVGATIEGKVAAAFLSTMEVETAVADGRLRVVAVASATRLTRLPQVPTLIESGIDLEFGNWRGLVARPNLPDADRERLLQMVAALAASPHWRDLVAARGAQDAYLPAPAFAVFIAGEKARISAAFRGVGVLKPGAD